MALESGRDYPVRELMVVMAGTVAARMATQGSEPGWRRPSSRRRVTSWHECGHIITALACGYFPHGVTIIPHIEPAESPELSYAGKATIATVPILEDGPAPSQPLLRSDAQAMRQICRSLAKTSNLEAEGLTIRDLFIAIRKRTESLLEMNRLKLSALAFALEKTGKLNGAEISKILGLGSQAEAAEHFSA